MTATTEYGIDLRVQLGIGRQQNVGIWDAGRWDTETVWGQPDTALGDWVDVTCSTEDQFTLTAGASDADGVVTRWEAATCALRLIGDQWDPWSGPYAGIVGPQVALRVGWKRSADVEWLSAFTGTVAADGWDWQPGSRAYVDVSATDATQNLAANDPPERAATGIGDTAAERVNRILDIAAWPANLRDVTAGGVKMKSSTMADALWTQLLNVADTDLALMWFRRDGRLAFRPEGRVLAGVDLAARLVICPPPPPVPNVGPVAQFTHSESELTTTVDASSSTDPDGTIVAYAWTFGDGGTASGVTASHTYASAGTRTVTLTVTDNDDATNATTRQVSVTGPTTFTETFAAMPSDITRHASVAIDNAVGLSAPSLHSSGAGWWWQGNAGSRWDIIGDFTYTFDIKINGPGDGGRDIYQIVFWGNGSGSSQNGFTFRLQTAANDGGIAKIVNGNTVAVPGVTNDFPALNENVWYRVTISAVGTVVTISVPRMRDDPRPEQTDTRSVDLASQIDATHPTRGYFGQRDGIVGSSTGDWIDNITVTWTPSAAGSFIVPRDARAGEPDEIQVVTIGGAQFADIRNVVSVSRQKEEGGPEPTTTTVRDDASADRYLTRTYSRTDLQHQDDGWSGVVANAILASSAWPSRAPREATLSSRLGDANVPPLLLALEADNVFEVEDTSGAIWSEGCVGWNVTVGRTEINGVIQLSDVSAWIGGVWDTGEWDRDRWSYAVTVPTTEE